MPYVLHLEPDERLLTDILYQPSKNVEAFRFALTDKNLYLPAKRFVVSGDPAYFQAVPLTDIREVHLQAIKPYGSIVLAVVMVAIGLVVLSLLITPGAFLTARGIGVALALVAGGALLPLASRGRYRLIIRWDKGVFRWVPPMVVFPEARRQVNQILDQIHDGFDTIDVAIRDERPPAS